MILDVGCGAVKRGDVGVDLFLETRHIKQYEETAVRTDLDVMADVCCLPFRDGAFDGCVSYQVIEHIGRPIEMLKEMVRVSKHFLHVECPHRMSGIAKQPYHLNYFNGRWFSRVFARFPMKVVNYDFRPVFVMFRWPNNCIVDVFFDFESFRDYGRTHSEVHIVS